MIGSGGATGRATSYGRLQPHYRLQLAATCGWPVWRLLRGERLDLLDAGWADCKRSRCINAALAAKTFHGFGHKHLAWPLIEQSCASVAASSDEELALDPGSTLSDGYTGRPTLRAGWR